VSTSLLVVVGVQVVVLEAVVLVEVATFLLE